LPLRCVALRCIALGVALHPAPAREACASMHN
jgi:hypothetical protein